jgi:photosystem II stability/assembly factor-like uncharacterized protein
MKKQSLALACAVAALVAACGGGSSTSSQSPSFAAMIGSASGGGADVAATGTRWQNVKYGGGGYVPGLIFHPTSPNVLYARTDVGGAYRWDPATSTWVSITDSFGVTEGFYTGIESMALDPTDDQRVYMVTGLYAWQNQNARLYISKNRGDTWTHVDLPFRAGGNDNGRAIGERLMVDPNKPSVLYFGSRASGLWKSEDYGQTWSQVTSLSSFQYPGDQIANLPGRTMGGIENVLFDTSTTNSGTATQTIYAAVGPDYGNAAGLKSSLYKSTDGGATWTAVDTPVTGYHIPHMVRAKDGMIYVAFAMGMGPAVSGPTRLFKFDGTNWTLLKSYDTQQWFNWGIGGLSVSGSGPTTRIAVGVSNTWGNWQGLPIIQVSDDAGLTWREKATQMPHNPDAGFWGWIDDVEIDPNNPDHIMHVTGGGIWETKNASADTPTWTGMNAGIEETATLALMTPPKGANYTLLNSSGDIGTHVQTELLKTSTRSPDNTWSNGIGADMAWSNPAYIAAIGRPGNVPSTIHGVYSTDSGVTWTKFATEHPDAAKQFTDCDVASVAVTKPNNVVWAPCGGAVPAYTTDNGATWTYTNLPALPGVGSDRAYRVVADRKNPNKVYAYNSGGVWWNQWSDTPHFWYSTDGGHTFTESKAFAGLSIDDHFNNTSVAVNPNVEGDLWVVDGRNVLHSTDSGMTWTKLNGTTPVFDPGNPYTPSVGGATSIALGRPVVGATYSASIYIVGTINNVWGVYRSDDAGNNWKRINDDKHQYGGLGNLAADQSVPGRVFASGMGRGVVFSY